MSEGILVGDRRATALASPTSPVPVTLLTGFLGAGKTTLLNRILNGDHGLRVGVLVNDFGAVNVDAALVEAVAEDAISLANGCVCCEIRDDLMVSIARLLELNTAIDHVVIEASGIADPEGVATTLVEPLYGGLVTLDTITCLVDADTFLDDTVPAEVTALKLRQVGCSDLVILNKYDLVGPAYAQAVRQVIGGFAPNLSVVDAIDADVPMGLVLGAGRYRAGQVEVSTTSTAVPGFEAFHYRSSVPLSMEALESAVRQLPSEVYRVKGFVYTSHAPQRRAVLQAVGRRTSVTYDHGWGDVAPRTDLVVIGASGQLDERALALAFDNCQVAADGSRSAPSIE